MALVFPTDDVDDLLVQRGAGYLYFAPQTVAGADPAALFFLGATEGGIEWDPKLSRVPIEIDQRLNSIGSFPSKETPSMKTTLVQVNLANLWNAIGTAQSGFLTGGDQFGSVGDLLLGEWNARRYMQLVWLGARPGDSSGTRTYQFWKATPFSAAALKTQRDKITSVAVEWMLHTDIAAQAAGLGAYGKIIDAA